MTRPRRVVRGLLAWSPVRRSEPAAVAAALGLADLGGLAVYAALEQLAVAARRAPERPDDRTGLSLVEK